MSEKTNKKLSPLEVVERYHQRYLAYERAFYKDPFNEGDLQKKVLELAQSGIDLDSEEFENQMVDLVVDKPQKRADVNNAAFKFALFTDFYLLTQEEELPKEILKDYDSLPIKDSIKSFFSVDDEGNFVKNEETEVSDDMRNFFKAIIQQTKLQPNQQ